LSKPFVSQLDAQSETKSKMKVVKLHYKGKESHVFLYSGMSSDECVSIVRAAVGKASSASASASSSASSSSPPIVALRNLTLPSQPSPYPYLLPLTRAIEHLDDISGEVEVLDMEQLEEMQREVEAKESQQRADRASKTKPQRAASARQHMANRNGDPSRRQPYRPQSARLASEPTSVTRHSDEATRWTMPRQAWDDESPSDSPYYASATAPNVGASRRFSALNEPPSPSSSMSSSSWLEPSVSPPPSYTTATASSGPSGGGGGFGRGSGVHVVLSYPQLLSVLTHHTAPNINNGPLPRVVRSGLDHMHVLALVETGVESSEDLFLAYQRLSSSRSFPRLVFLLMESGLVDGTALECDHDELPALQFFLHGHLIGQLSRPTKEQMEAMMTSANKLMQENPNVMVEEGDTDADEEDAYEEEYNDDEEAYFDASPSYSPSPSPSRSPLRNGRPFPVSFGEALDAHSAGHAYGYGVESDGDGDADERRQLYDEIIDEERRWSQLLQPSPKQKPRTRPTLRPSPLRRGQGRQAWMAALGQTPSSSPSRSPLFALSDSDDGYGYDESPDSGLIIRGRKIDIQTMPTTQLSSRSQAERRAAARSFVNPESRLRDWEEYERFNDERESEESDSSESSSESEEGKRQMRGAYARQQAQRQQQRASANGLTPLKRKLHPAGSSEEEEDESDEEYSKALIPSPHSSVSSSPIFAAARVAPAPMASSSSPATSGFSLSESESAAIESVLRREHASVRRAFLICPQLESVMDVFMRLVQNQTNIMKQQNHATSAAPSSASATASQQRAHQDRRLQTPTSALKRKMHPDADEEPLHKRSHLEIQEERAREDARARAAHKRVNRIIYGDESESESESEDEEAKAQRELDDAAEAFADAQAQFHASSAEEAAALRDLEAQRERFNTLSKAYAKVQDQIFSSTLHDLYTHGEIERKQHEVLVRLWTETEGGSNAIRAAIGKYEVSGDEQRFRRSLLSMANKFLNGEAVEVEAEVESDEDADETETEELEDEVSEEANPSTHGASSPLPSDEERAYQSMLRSFASELGIREPDSNAHATVGTRANTTADTKPLANQTQGQDASDAGLDEDLLANLQILEQLVEGRLLAPQEGTQAAQYLLFGHPLLQAAFLAFGYNEDVEDLVDSIQIILQQAKERAKKENNEVDEEEEEEVKEQEPNATDKDDQSRSSPTTTTLTDPSQLLALLPPYLVSSHGGVIASLVVERDPSIVTAWNELQEAFEVRGVRREALAKCVEQLIEKVEMRVGAKDDGEDEEEEEDEDDEEDDEPARSSVAPDSTLAQALQVVSVLHTGDVFDARESARLWEMILAGNPVILAAFENARIDQEWEELHDTLSRLLEKHEQQYEDEDDTEPHPLERLVDQAPPAITEQHVQLMKRIMQEAKKQSAGQGDAASANANAKDQGEGALSTPEKRKQAAASLPPAGTPISPSIPQTSSSRLVSLFTRSLETLQSRSLLTDAQALQLIDLFQPQQGAKKRTMHPGIEAAAQVWELDGDDEEFMETLRIIVQEEEERQTREKKKSKDQQAIEEEEEEEDGDEKQQERAQSQLKSFAQRVQFTDDPDAAVVAEGDENEDDDEDEQEDEDDDDDAISLGSLDDLLSRPEEDWNGDDLAFLMDKVQTMQLELGRLREIRAQALDQLGENVAEAEVDEEEKGDEEGKEGPQ